MPTGEASASTSASASGTPSWSGSGGPPPEVPADDLIPKDIEEVEKRLRSGAGGNTDVIIRELTAGPAETRMLVVYVDGLANKTIVDQHIIAPIVRAGEYGVGLPPGAQAPPDLSSLEVLSHQILTAGAIQVETRFSMAEMAFCSGHTVIFVDGADRAIVIETRGYEKRAVTHPDTERSTRASREGFIESLSTNLALVRRHVKDPSLRIETTTAGRRTHTVLAILWLEGLTNPALVEAVRQRLKAIDVDRVIDSYDVEYYLKDDPWTPFPLVRGTERPDFSAHELLDGKVVILAEESAFALIVPATLADFYRTTDDYVHNYMAVTLIRFIRFVANTLVLFLAAGYVALIDIHPELIPTDLALSIAGSREGVPFPAIIEVVIMLLVFEILHEATLRLPGMMGPTIGTVGGLVIGQAAVQARIISDVMVIIIALQAVSAFTQPSVEISLTWRVLTWGSIFSAGFLGIYGIVLYGLLLVAHLSSLTSLGLPYTAPNAPWSGTGQRDNLIRASFHRLTRRPPYLYPKDLTKRRPYDQPAEHPKPPTHAGQGPSSGGGTKG